MIELNAGILKAMTARAATAGHPMVGVYEITPEFARSVLSNASHANRANRRLYTSSSDAYAKDISCGEWGVTGDTIKFSYDFRLLDGQHRLNAVDKAGVGIVTAVAFGVDEALFTDIDGGKPRSGSDLLKIAGCKRQFVTDGAIRWYMILTSSKPWDRTKTFRPKQKCHFWESLSPADKDMMARAASRGEDVQRARGHSQTMLAGLYFYLARASGDEQSVAAMYDQWAQATPQFKKIDRAVFSKFEPNSNSGRGLIRTVYEPFFLQAVIRMFNRFSVKRALTTTEVTPDLSQEWADIWEYPR
jgi:hypothetical protein